MAKWLERIKEPRDIRGLPIDQLKEIAGEIRDEILRVTATNGGHLASSLGVVELTLALHYVFDTPRDRIVWDVGHQAYAHKLLTGRAGRFHTIRKEGGLSGFLRRSESPYDAYGAGHASTSMSAALGMAIARDRKGEDYKVVSVTGDGAMSGGICYEALNNAGMLKTDLLMILNDNEMSISPNVGALAHYFNRIITTHFYNEKRRGAIEFIKRLPAGQRFLNLTNRVEESVKGLIVPGILFEELGVRYLGPVDGHNLEDLIPILRKVHGFSGPILLHVITVKGKGRDYAEADPVTFHSPPLHFNAESGEAPATEPGPPTFTEVFAESLTAEARADGRIVALTAAMLEGTGLTRFQEEFPDRTYDVGIAEEHAVIQAAGMACEGLRPWVCIYSSFMQRAIDPILHDVALQKLPVAFALDRSGIVGADGPTHHGVFDLTYLRMIPDMVVMAPMDGAELRDMIHTAAHYDAGPIAVRFPRGKTAAGDNLTSPPRRLPIGRGQVLIEGEDVCLVGIGTMAAHALEAARLLEAGGIRVGVINARFAKPLDRDLILRAACRYSCLITVEDNAVAGGFGAAVLELLAIGDARAPAGDARSMAAPGESRDEPRVITLGIPDQFVEHGSPASLYHQCGLSAEAIAARVRRELTASARIHAARVHVLARDEDSPAASEG
ncbi:MAG: 1-deoxy-D-xylulose-5-phosphate synthase [bacterium]|nr:1-deoxy-D-xylulose-5-phosphate synthase [bacterium]